MRHRKEIRIMVSINIKFRNVETGEVISETVEFENHDERHKYCAGKCSQLNSESACGDDWSFCWFPTSGMANDLF